MFRAIWQFWHSQFRLRSYWEIQDRLGFELTDASFFEIDLLMNDDYIPF